MSNWKNLVIGKENLIELGELGEQELYSLKLSLKTNIQNTVTLDKEMLEKLGVDRQIIQDVEIYCTGGYKKTFDCVKDAVNKVKSQINKVYACATINHDKHHYFLEEQMEKVVEEIDNVKNMVVQVVNNWIDNYQEEKESFAEEIRNLTKDNDELLSMIMVQYPQIDQLKYGLQLTCEIYEVRKLEEQYFEQLEKVNNTQKEKLLALQKEYLNQLNESIDCALTNSQNQSFTLIGEVLGKIGSSQLDKKLEELENLAIYNPPLKEIIALVVKMVRTASGMSLEEIETTLVQDRQFLIEQLAQLQQENSTLGQNSHYQQMQAKVNGFDQYHSLVARLQTENLEPMELEQIILDIQQLRETYEFRHKKVQKLLDKNMNLSVEPVALVDLTENGKVEEQVYDEVAGF
jgi:hypothetical protein